VTIGSAPGEAEATAGGLAPSCGEAVECFGVIKDPYGSRRVIRSEKAGAPVSQRHIRSLDRRSITGRPLFQPLPRMAGLHLPVCRWTAYRIILAPKPRQIIL